MKDNFYAVIMAGGGGTRLWPLSRKKTPKQMLRLSKEHSLFQIAVERLSGLFTPDKILVVTVAEQAIELKKQCPSIPEENFILEPKPKGTASVVGLAARVIQHRNSDSVMAVLTADHFISNETYFQELLKSAKEVALDNYLVTIGIRPTYPATGYGYIHRAEFIKTYQDNKVYRVNSFKEKPDQDLAQTFFERQDHDWNSGMFIWRVDRILNEIEHLMPQLSQNLDKIAASWDSQQKELINAQIWNDIQPETIDYGIMEKAERVAVLPASDLGWNDVGSWESLFDVLSPDENGNILIDTNHLGINTSSSLICSDKQDRLIVTIGLKDVIIVETEDALLCCNRKDSQDVKKLVDILKNSGRNQYL